MLTKLAELHKICFPNRPWGAEEFASLKKSGAEILAGDNGFIVWRCAADECEIITIGVHPDARRTGIADAILIIAEGEMKKSGAARVFLEVAENNAAAKSLYEKHEYRQIATRPKYYDNIDLSAGDLAKVDAAVMEKVL